MKNSVNFLKKKNVFNRGRLPDKYKQKIMSSELITKIEQDMREAMKQKDVLRLSALRMVLAAAYNKGKEKRAKGGEEELTQEEATAVLRSEAKKRRDSIQEFVKGGRQDLAEKETAELSVLEKYLPAEMPEEDLQKIVQEVMAGFGQATIKDFGKIMGEVMKKTKGQVSGDRISQKVRSIIEMGSSNA